MSARTGLRPAALLSALLAAGLVASLRGSPVEELSPELGHKLSKLAGEAGGFYQKKDHQKAIETYQQMLALLPPQKDLDQIRMQVHYSIACSYALQKKEKETVSHLEQAVENGLTQMMYLDRNNDFDAVRASPGFAALAEKMQKKAEAEGRKKLEALKGFDFKLETVDGRNIQKKDYLGKVLIVDVWGTWCPPCRAEIPHFIDLLKRYQDQGLRIVGLNSEKSPDLREAARLVRQFTEEFKVNYPCALATPEVLKSIPELEGFPTTLFFGRDGAPRAMEVGARDLTALEAIVKRLLAEPAPAAPPPPAK